MTAHRVFRIERDEPLPTGEGVLIPHGDILSADRGDTVVLAYGAETRQGAVVDLVEDDHGAHFVAVTFQD